MLINATSQDINERLDNFLCKKIFSNLSRSYIQKLIEDGKIFINSKSSKSNYKLRLNDQISFDESILKNITQNNQHLNQMEEVFEEEDEEKIRIRKTTKQRLAFKEEKYEKYINESTQKESNQKYTLENDIINKEWNLEPFEFKLDIIDETKDFIILNKPQNLTTHPSHQHENDTLVNALIYKYKTKELSNNSGSTRPGIVHRLDKDTSGLMVVAKNNISHANISTQIQEGECKRKYLAICYGVFKPLTGTINYNLVKDKKNFKKFNSTTKDEGKTAITHYTTVEILLDGLFSLVEFELETGRTHQIRSHSLAKNHPIIGDKMYFKDQNNSILTKLDLKTATAIKNLTGQMLHSYFLQFQNPKNHKTMQYTQAPNKQFLNILNLLKSQTEF